MRKDAKIGFAIGGVLLAVLTVYVIVVPRHHNAISPNAVTLSVPTDESAADMPNTAAPDTADAKTAQPTALAKNTGDGVNWERLLNGGGTDTDVAPPLMTTTTSTPTAGSGVTVPPATGSGANSSPVMIADSTTPAGPATRPTMAAATTLVVDPPAGAHKAAATGTRQYTIKSGQTLSSIAGEVYGNSRFYVAILRANPGLNPNRLRPGDKITLPDASEVNPAVSMAVSPTVEHGTAGTGRTYTVKSGDTLYAISKELFGTTRQAEAIYDLNKQTIGANEAKLTVGMILKLPEAASGPTVSVR